MALLLELSPHQEQAVHERAREEGVSPSELIARVLDEAEITAPPLPQTSAEKALALVREWQRRDGTPTVPPEEGDGTLTPSAVLFRRWEEEDSHLTEAELQAEEEFWEAFQRGINAEREAAGQRTIF